jgi:hypothetical protein
MLLLTQCSEGVKKSLLAPAAAVPLDVRKAYGFPRLSGKRPSLKDMVFSPVYGKA